jgi:hypothetical protein
MEITVRFVNGRLYSEIKITEGDTTIETGLLNKQEAVELARNLINAANELLATGK